MPHRYIRAVEPVVQHGLREMSLEGASLEHVIREVALMGALVGAGSTATEAIRQVEAIERELIGPSPAGEYLGAGAGAVPGAGMYGKGKGMPGVDMYGKGKGMPGVDMYGKGKGMPGAGMYGKGKGMPGAGMYGKGKGASPYGTGGVQY